MLNIKPFFDPATYTLTYVVFANQTRDAIVIDPVLDYDPAASRVSEESVQEVIEFLKGQELTLHLILETHAHADHLSGSQVLKRVFPNAQVAIGARIREVQKVFKGVFNLPGTFKTDGSQFDKLLEDGETVRVGALEFKTIFTPGHTPACASYLFGDSLFTGDALFMPDFGTGRCDFPSGNAEDLYKSVQKLYALPDSTRVFVGHDYQPGGRELKWESSIAEEKQKNIQLKLSTSKDEFVQFRKTRDQELAAPRLLLPSVQININAGKLPEPAQNGMRYLSIPLRA